MIAWAEIERYCAAIVREFHPKQIVLFGSYAYGQPTPDSDVDVLVLIDGLAQFRCYAMLVYGSFRIAFAQLGRRNALDTPSRADDAEKRRLDTAVRSVEYAGSRPAVRRLVGDFEPNGQGSRSRLDESWRPIKPSRR